MIRTAVVTAGGTSEPIDDVRVVTNLSTGRFGAALANALAAVGVQVTLLAGRSLIARRHLVRSDVRVVPFGSHRELDAALAEACAEGPDLLLMAAAVSDYAPEPTKGKIRSSGDALVVRMARTPKLLDRLRARCGPATTLVGFKLLSGVPQAELEAVARAQNERCDLDFTVANDLAGISAAHHPVLLVPREGPAHRIVGSKVESAGQLVARLVPAPPIDHALLADLPGITEVRPLDHGLALPTVTAPTVAAAWHALGRAYPPDGFSVALPAGTVLGLPDPDRFDAEVAAMSRRAPERGDPLLLGVAPIGVLVRRGVAVAPWIAPEHRGEGLGDDVACALDHLGREVELPTSHAPFLIARGWRPTTTSSDPLPDTDEPVRLTPPSRRNDLRPAASVCLVHGDRVLIGRRRVGAWPGYWAFPGGGVEPGESRVAAALRELAEETGVAVPPGEPIGQVDVAVSWQDGARGYDLTCFVFPVPIAPPPTPTAELEAAWVPLARATRLRPMAAGTRRVLRRLPALLGAA